MPEDTIPLASLGKGAVYDDGDSVVFEVIGHDDKKYRFACPHEALDQIISALQSLAAIASEARDKADPEKLEPAALPLSATFLPSEVQFLLSNTGEEVLLAASTPDGQRVNIAFPPTSLPDLQKQLKRLEKKIWKARASKLH